MKTTKFLLVLLFALSLSNGFAQTARVQVIHNSADILAGSVDIYINNVLEIPDFAFRTATPFIDLPAGVTLNIGVAPGNSTSVNDTLKELSSCVNRWRKIRCVCKWCFNWWLCSKS